MKLLYFVNLVTINLHKSIRHIGRKIKSGNPLSRLGPFNIACKLYEQIKENSHDFWIFKLCGIYIYQYQCREKVLRDHILRAGRRRIIVENHQIPSNANLMSVRL